MSTSLRQMTRWLWNSQPFDSARPPMLTVEWEATNTCNAHCLTCLDWLSHADSTVMNTESARYAIGQLVEAGLNTLIISGGEPLMRKDLAELVAFTKSHDIRVELLSNGLLMTERVARKLVDAGLDIISISIDAANPELNDMLRGMPGYFARAEAAMDSLKAMRRNGHLRIHILTTVTRRNIGELVSLAELAENKGLDGFHIQLAQMIENKNFVLPDDLVIDAGSRAIFLEQLDALVGEHAAILAGPGHYYERLRAALESPATAKTGRLHSSALFQMDAWGNIFTSRVKNHKLGNIRHTQFQDICAAADIQEVSEMDEGFGPGCNVVSPAEIERNPSHGLFRFVRPVLSAMKLI